MHLADCIPLPACLPPRSPVACSSWHALHPTAQVAAALMHPQSSRWHRWQRRQAAQAAWPAIGWLHLPPSSSSSSSRRWHPALICSA